MDVLNWDEWIIWANLVEKLQDGGLSLTDLAAQQNEQRNLAARLFGLLLLPVFRLNRFAECALNIALAGGMFFLVWRLYKQTATPTAAPPPVLGFSLLCFSLLQWETFSVGINSAVLLPPLAMWAGAVLLSRGALTWGRLLVTISVGVIPSFSFVNGLFYWICLAPLVALRSKSGWQRAAKTCFFLLAGGLVWAAYFHGYSRPPHHPSPLIALTQPLALGGYSLAYLGGAIVGDKNLLPLGIMAGAAALALLSLYLGPLHEHSRRKDWLQVLVDVESLAPWLSVAMFSLLSAMATAIGRSGFGLEHALESRYATFSTPLWIVLVALSALREHTLGERAKRWGQRILTACLALFLLSSVLSGVVLRNRAPKLAAAREELFRCTDTQKLKAVFPDPAYIVLKLPLFLKQRVAMYRDIKPLDRYILAEKTKGNFTLKQELGVSGRVCGYLAVGETSMAKPLLVLFCQAGRVAAVTMSDSNGHFAFFIPDNAFPSGECALHALALDPDGNTLHPLGPVEGLSFLNTPCPTPPLWLEKYFHVS